MGGCARFNLGVRANDFAHEFTQKPHEKHANDDGTCCCPEIPMIDHYETLGLPSNATPEQIRERFHELAREHHPDRPTGDEEKFKEIEAAYAALTAKPQVLEEKQNDYAPDITPEQIKTFEAEKQRKIAAASKCKKGCGRTPPPGKTRNGNSYNTCCRE